MAVLAVSGVLSGCALPEARDSDGGLACARAAEPRYVLPRFSPDTGVAGFEALARANADARAIFVGERHTSYEDHLHQLATICAFDGLEGQMVIGLEAVQWPFQRHLDDYVGGRIDLDTMLDRIEYYDRWRYDFRLLEPVFELARNRQIRLIALNAPAEVTRAVARLGIDGLDDALRARLPRDIDRSSADYARRLELVWRAHAPHGEDDDALARFTDAQRVWDETMAERTVAALRAAPGARIVVLAGTGHVSHDNTIAHRVRRRLPIETLVLAPLDESAPASPDVIYIEAPSIPLAPAGRLGVFLAPRTEGAGVRIDGLADGGAAAAAGLEAGDRIVAIDDRPITDVASVHLAMRRAAPGDLRRVRVMRADDAAPVEAVLTLR